VVACGVEGSEKLRVPSRGFVIYLLKFPTWDDEIYDDQRAETNMLDSIGSYDALRKSGDTVSFQGNDMDQRQCKHGSKFTIRLESLRPRLAKKFRSLDMLRLRYYSVANRDELQRAGIGEWIAGSSGLSFPIFHA